MEWAISTSHNSIDSLGSGPTATQAKCDYNFDYDSGTQSLGNLE